MTTVYELEAEDFSRIEGGQQTFITLRDGKPGIKGGDRIVFQHISEEEGAGVREVTMAVDFTYYEGLKQGWVTCALKEVSYS